tara:strand:+ start:3759 stop:4028 length:270 start_codon:yes stop_codon:yes gene_type:complete
MDAADRRLLKSTMELQAINRGLKRADGDQSKMNKELKKIRRYFKSPLAEVARLDNTLYNITKPTQTVQDEHKGTETEGTDPSVGKSTQT